MQISNIVKVMREIALVSIVELPSLLIAFLTLKYVVSLQPSCPLVPFCAQLLSLQS
jgi:hypothetical protein